MHNKRKSLLGATPDYLSPGQGAGKGLPPSAPPLHFISMLTNIYTPNTCVTNMFVAYYWSEYR